MPKTAKPRKKYVPRGVKPLITQGLVDELGQDLHFGLMALTNGGASAANWKRICHGMFVVSIATDEHPDLDRADKVAIDSAVLTLTAISDRQVRTKQWQATELDLPSLKRGILAAERVIPMMDYRALARAYHAVNQLIRTIKD